MSDHELLDTFDDQGRFLGVAARVDVHLQGLWHQVAHILVVAHRPAGPVAILQRRARIKRTFAGLIDLSATGHLAAGEHPRDGVRELREELGIDINPDELFPLGVRRLVDTTPEGVNRELAHVFVVRHDAALADYRPDPAEVEAVVEAPIDALLAVLDPDLDPRPSAAAVEIAVGGEPREIVVGAADLVPEPRLVDVSGAHPHAYWVSALSAGRAYLQGERPLAV